MRKLVAVEPELYERLQKRGSIQSRIVSDLDKRMPEILNLDLSQPEKLSLYSEALQKLIHFGKKSSSATSPKSPIAEGEILKKIPKPKQTRAKKVLQQIKDSKNVGWDDKHRLTLDRQAVHGSDISELVDEAATRITKSRKRKKPIGWSEFESIWQSL